jgi:hypothetical protein
MARAMGLKIPAVMVMAAALLTGSRTRAQEPAPAGANLAEFAARRYPQPVRVGDLIGRPVLQPLESRPVLGHVTRVVRLANGSIRLVMNFGGWFGFGSRVIAVPVDAMVLLGSELEILDFTPEQLRRFPTDEGAGDRVLADDDVIRMGLAHPSH